MSDFAGTYWFDTMVKPATPPASAKDGDREAENTAPPSEKGRKVEPDLKQPVHLTRGDF